MRIEEDGAREDEEAILTARRSDVKLPNWMAVYSDGGFVESTTELSLG